MWNCGYAIPYEICKALYLLKSYFYCWSLKQNVFNINNYLKNLGTWSCLKKHSFHDTMQNIKHRSTQSTHFRTNGIGDCKKLSVVRDKTESSSTLSGTALSKAERCPGQHIVKLNTVQVGIKQSSELYRTVLSQAEHCPGQHKAKLSVVWYSADLD